MSTNRVPKSAKSGRVLRDKFQTEKPFILFEGVGRMQKRAVNSVLFDLTDDDKTIPFVVCFGRTHDGAKYVVDGVRYSGKGDRLSPAKTKTRKKAKAKPTAEPEQVDALPIEETEEMPTASEMGI